MSKEPQEFLTDREQSVILLNLAYSRGPYGYSAEEGQTVIDWARQSRVDLGLLHSILTGRLFVDVDTDGEILFRTSRGGQDFRRETVCKAAER